MSRRQVIGDRFEIRDRERVLLGRGGMGDVYREGHRERAVELYALDSHYPYVSCSRWFEDVAGAHIAAAAAQALPPEIVAAAQARGQARELESTLRDLLIELSE